MNVFGFAEVSTFLKQGAYFLKFIVNESGAAFFTQANQHRDMKIHGLSYEDDYAGNALAGTLTQDRIDLRFHSRFSDARVASIMSTLLIRPELEAIQSIPVYYQGRSIPAGQR